MVVLISSLIQVSSLKWVFLLSSSLVGIISLPISTTSSTRTYTITSQPSSSTQFLEPLHEVQIGEDKEDTALTWLIVFLTVACLLATTQLFLSVLLLVGAEQKNAAKCMPWVYFNVPLAAVLGVGWVVTFGSFTEYPTTLLLVLLLGLLLPLHWYFVHVVRRFVSLCH